MIWLASFPRSGNTFFRNILYEVYGLESSSYHRNPQRPLKSDYYTYPVIKTHVLPEQLPEELPDRPVIYLIRDGRDSIVSTAHQRKDITVPGSDFYINLLLAIIPRGNNLFGGWSRNVTAWTEKAALCIYFKDLIANPLQEVEKLNNIFPLPPAKPERLPTFKSQKSGNARYKGGTQKGIPGKFFRSGKRGGWRNELPEELHALFWDLHRPAMLAHGFTEGSPPELTDSERQQLAQFIINKVNKRPDVTSVKTEFLKVLPFLLQYGQAHANGLGSKLAQWLPTSLYKLVIRSFRS